VAKQHIVPQFYLKPFLTNGWVYRKRASAPRRTKNPAGAAAERDYYGSDEAVDHLNSLAEGYGAPAMKKLIYDPDSMKESDYVGISLLFANLYVRTRVAIEELRTMELFWTDQVNEIARVTGSKRFRLKSREINEESSTTLEQINEYANGLIANDGHRLAARDSFLAIPDIAECIRNMSFLIIEAPPKSFFVTSDRPLLLRSRSSGSLANVGWKKRDAVGCIALSPGRFLQVFYDKEPLYQRMAKPNEVPDINRQTIMAADLEVYSKFECDEAAEWMTGRTYR
jgi:hypothetical protein